MYVHGTRVDSLRLLPNTRSHRFDFETPSFITQRPRGSRARATQLLGAAGLDERRSLSAEALALHSDPCCFPAATYAPAPWISLNPRENMRDGRRGPPRTRFGVLLI